MNDTISNDLQSIISHAIEDIKQELGDEFDIQKLNLAELQRRTGISRSKLRRLKKNNFALKDNGHKGSKRTTTVLSGHTGLLNDLLSKGVTNSVVLMERLRSCGYQGSISTIKEYVSQHRALVPAKRQLVSPQGNRGRRYSSEPGETFQMDWGFVNVVTDSDTTYRACCFAMICHHCGKRYVEFFPNAMQENLFIGMLHAFYYMGVPEYVLTDNMKSVVIGRDSLGHPLWQHDYESFMKCVGFRTKLCKPRHPFTKGAVERLIRFVKENFMIDRTFSNVTELNIQALRWCEQQNFVYHRAVDCIPNDRHSAFCSKVAQPLVYTQELKYYLCPERIISFDGFVNYEGRRFGVPCWYRKQTCRVCRKGYSLDIYDSDLTQILTSHDVTWSRKDSFCRDQYLRAQPEELPTAPVTSKIFEIQDKHPNSGFAKFNFEEVWDE